MVHAFADVQQYLSDDDRALIGLISSDPGKLPDALQDAAHLAEMELASGGFERYVALRVLSALLEKNVDFHAENDAERERKALAKFRKSETLCRLTNKRLRHYRRYWWRAPEQVMEVLSQAALYIQEALGPLDTRIGKIYAAADFGPGATYGDLGAPRGENRNAYFKLTGRQTVTAGALGHFTSAVIHGFMPALVSYWSVHDVGYDVVSGNRVHTVRKNRTIDRVIAIEASINILLQKGCGTVLVEDVLRPLGVTLRDQSRNREVARQGSISGWDATVDQSMASDLGAIEGVRWLLPGDWFDFLDSIRSPSYQLHKGGPFTAYQKFSSMGNATTFPIMSLIFWAIAKASAAMTGADAKRLRVYGDDVVIPVEAYALFSEAMRFLGYRINEGKTHVFGNFKETCGADFVHGVDVRPVFMDGRPTTESDVYDLYNRLQLISPVDMPNVCQYLLSLVKSPLWGPADVGMAEYGAWEPGASAHKRGYAIGDPPDPSGYCSGTQSHWWRFTKLAVRAGPYRGPVDWYAQYLLFLRGVPGGRITSSCSFRHSISEAFTFAWPKVSEIRGIALRRKLVKEPAAPTAAMVLPRGAWLSLRAGSTFVG
jgi:hypothetical protein